MSPQAATISWDSLEHAYGPASDVPALLDQFSKARGGKLREVTGELYSRVLHQGTIYSASPPVARAAIEMCRTAEGEKKLILYNLLAGFAEAARTAMADGRSIASRAGGNPLDGEAIRREILEARPRFEADLAHPDAHIRASSAHLLTAFPQAGEDAARAAQRRYWEEPDAEVREALVEGLTRLRDYVNGWSGFLMSALDHEDNPANRFSLRTAQIQEVKKEADSGAIQELVSTFLNTGDRLDRGERFFETLRRLDPERERMAMLQAIKLAAEENAARTIAEHLLRLVFEDQRDGWGQMSRSVVREDGKALPQPDFTSMALRSLGRLGTLLPFLGQRKEEQGPPKGIARIEYWGVKGEVPVVPVRLSPAQRSALLALAAQPEVWKFRSNLWQLFRLPDTAEGLLQLVEERG